MQKKRKNLSSWTGIAAIDRKQFTRQYPDCNKTFRISQKFTLGILHCLKNKTMRSSGNKDI